MDSPLESTAFLFIWMSFPLLMCGTMILFFLWGVRSGQFADQERARYLPLDSGIPSLPASPLPTSSLRREERRSVRESGDDAWSPPPEGRVREGERAQKP